MRSSPQNDWRELATRDGDGLEISLLWSKPADRVKVTVLDQRLDESFDIHIDGANALNAFEHPFAYVPPQTVKAEYAERHPRALRQQV